MPRRNDALDELLTGVNGQQRTGELDDRQSSRTVAGSFAAAPRRPRELRDGARQQQPDQRLTRLRCPWSCSARRRRLAVRDARGSATRARPKHRRRALPRGADGRSGPRPQRYDAVAMLSASDGPRSLASWPERSFADARTATRRRLGRGGAGKATGVAKPTRRTTTSAGTSESSSSAKAVRIRCAPGWRRKRRGRGLRCLRSDRSDYSEARGEPTSATCPLRRPPPPVSPTVR